MSERTEERFHYFRDHEISGAWGVRQTSSGVVMAVGLDKGIALAVALFLSGEDEKAREVRDATLPYYPEEDRA